MSDPATGRGEPLNSVPFAMDMEMGGGDKLEPLLKQHRYLILITAFVADYLRRILDEAQTIVRYQLSGASGANPLSDADAIK